MAHETGEPKNLFILGLGLGSIVTLLAIMYTLQSYYAHIRDEEQHRKVLGRTNPELMQMRDDADRKLGAHGFAIVDKNAGRVRIPVDSAITLLAARGRDTIPAIKVDPTMIQVAPPAGAAASASATPGGAAPGAATSATPAAAGAAPAGSSGSGSVANAAGGGAVPNAAGSASPVASPGSASGSSPTPSAGHGGAATPHH